jgi:hypothetical protein
MGLTSMRVTLVDARRPDLASIDAYTLVGTGAPRCRLVAPRPACDGRPGSGAAGMAPSLGPFGAVPTGGSDTALHRGQMAGGTNPANPNIPAFLAEGCR